MEIEIQLRKVLENLYDKLVVPDEFGEEEKEKILDEFWSYYHAKKRHNYHEVTLFILDKEKLDEQYYEEQIDLFSAMIKELAEIAQEKESGCSNLNNPHCCKFGDEFTCGESKDKKCYLCSISRCLSKLYDHILLEITRLGEIREANRLLKSELEQANKKLNSLDEKAEELNKQTTSLNEKTLETKNTLERTKKRLEDTQKEYITILGIFSSIVLAFIGGMVFSTSVLQNIGNGSIYRILAAVLVIAFTFLNMLFILVRFISEINSLDNNKIKYPKYMKWINLTLLCLLGVVVLCWFVDIQTFAENIRNMIYKR